ncbi:membrane transporter, putative [Plasmodium knowlesi strain H]|uniref:Monocarboxylate transporter, putative n=3 Tax=Plasmodium knowlesi TaxID=5850 RepID=B3L2T0_PLAKH|nr:monocarboxylate transporter, putative [Plasmodium knowlesi strain H]OTN67331.1 putative Membrane transporter [Plasmodium knowlesi]CAA9987533.1 monocarboxylate transporter, putative [Plasmodium knowlesi strain H]SBO23107.1 membrane transporter, putative [Plasmodium knowlesi strain H]VVS77007.1 monocarboxylate transporter, putative [Plasmodium knowlesi strain H]|eukprot:XP_002258534.1 membrane transporter, putative [Plasmodium knowlesi strain H]
MAAILPQRAIPYLVLAGAFLYNLNIGIINSYGNLNIYLTSYLRHKGQNVTYRDVSFIYELTVITLGVSMLIGNVVQKKLGERVTILVCSFTTFISFYLSSVYAHSYLMLCLFMGGLYGLGYGISFTIPLSCTYKHFKKNRGLVSGIVISAISLSPFLYCPLQTLLINRNNVLPVESSGGSSGGPRERYFEDPHVLGRIPHVLFVQSVIFLIFGTCGAFFATMEVRGDGEKLLTSGNLDVGNKKSKHLDEQDKSLLDIERNDDQMGITTDKNKGNQDDGTNEGDNLGSRLAKSFKKKKKKKMGAGINDEDGEGILNGKKKKKKKKTFTRFFLNMLNVNTTIFSDNNVQKYYNKRCTEDVFFFFLWLSVVLFNSYINFVIMYWKIIGITYTSMEDKFITLNGSFINSMANIAGRLIWGSIYDKLQVHVTVTLLGTCICCACFLLPAISHIYILYAFTCALFYFCIGGSLVTIPIITLKKYGELHFPLNMSILYTTRIANTFLCSVVVRLFYSLFTLRCLSSAFGLISLAATVVMFFLTQS